MRRLWAGSRTAAVRGADAAGFARPGFWAAGGGMRARGKMGMLAGWWLLAQMPLQGLARDPGLFPGDVPPPPEASPLNVEVPRGGPVWITISAYSISSPVIRYRIKRKTQAGKLIGTPEVVSADTGRVKYLPPAGAGPGEDSFSYQVQSAQGVSAPAEVHITITDTAPVLITPGDVEFGDLLPGQSAKRQLVLQNIGGGLARGEVSVPEGWSVEGDPAYHVGAGEKQTFTLVFKPAGVGTFTGDIEYTGNPERATDLNGEVLAPIAVTTGTVGLREAGEMRIGTIHVENRTDQDRTLKVTGGQSLDTGAMVTVPAKGAADILVRAKGRDAVNDLVTVEGEGVKEEVAVHGPAIAGMPAPPPPAAIFPAIAEAAATPAAQIPQADARAPLPAGGDAGTPEATVPALALPTGPDNQAEAGPVIREWPLEMARPGATEAMVACNFKHGPVARSFRLELETVGMDARGRPVAEWVPFTRVTLREQGQIVAARMLALRPGALYMVRLVGLDEHGNVIEISSTGQIWTQVPKRSTGWWWWAAAAAAVLAGGGYWAWSKGGTGLRRDRGWR